MSFKVLFLCTVNLYHKFMKKIRLFGFLAFFILVELGLLGLANWQHGRMLEKVAVSQAQQSQSAGEIVPFSQAETGDVVNITAYLEPEKAIFLLHQKHNETAGWRYVVPAHIDGKKLWLDLGWLAPQPNKLTPSFSDYTQNIYHGTAVVLAVSEPKGWLESPVYTANARVWNRLDRGKMGAVYLSAQVPLYRNFAAQLPQGLSAKKHAQYRNTWLVLAFLLLIFCGIFLQSLKSKNS